MWKLSHMDQLPRQVKTFEHTTNFEILEENLYDGIAVYGDFFLTDVFTVTNVNASSFILFLCSYAVALFRYVNWSSNITYFFVDSHCNYSRGTTNGKPGFSVLI